MEKDTQKTVLVFNADLQRETAHIIDIDNAGEILVTCQETGRFLKFPKGYTALELKDALKKHAETNEGDITLDYIEHQKAELLEGLTDSEA